MGFVFLFAFLVLFLLLPPVLGFNYSTAYTCPENFICHYEEAFSEPSFSNSLQSDSCGLCLTICKNFLPKINLNPDPRSMQWFDVVEVLKNNVVKLRDTRLQSLLRDQDCNSFSSPMKIPQFNDSISYNIVRNSTLFICSKLPTPSKEMDIHFHGYIKYSDCTGFDVYYMAPEYDGAGLGTESSIPLPHNCSTIQLPIRPSEEVSNNRNLFDLLTADFELEWHTRNNCSRVCDLEDTSNYFCSKDKTVGTQNSGIGKKSLEIIIGTCVAGAAFLILLAVLLILYKKQKGISVLPRGSSEPSSKLDLEGGSAVYFGISVFSYGELEEITNNFDVSKELGSGGFGTVYYGKLCDGREVAVKRLYEHNFRHMAQFLNEVEMLSHLRHPNLVSLYGCTSRRSRELLLVYEYIPNGTVADHVHGDRAKDKSLTWPVRMSIAIETATALAFLHASDIIHRDVKTNNILLGYSFQVKVADFGLSRLFPSEVSHISTAPQGTPGYVDPEYHQCYHLTDKSDVYSFGVVLIELISSMPAVDIRRHRDEINLAKLAINRIQRHAFVELIDLSLGYESDPAVMRMTISVAELAFRCLQPEKELRPSMDEVLETLKEIQDCK